MSKLRVSAVGSEAACPRRAMSVDAAVTPAPMSNERRVESTIRRTSTQYFHRCGLPGCQCGVHRAPMTDDIGMLTGEVQGVLNRPLHLVRRIQSARRHVA